MAGEVGEVVFSFFILFLGTAIDILGVLLWMRRVSPNRWVGIRLANMGGENAIWYEVNSFLGRLLVGEGLFIVALSIFYMILPVTFTLVGRVLVFLVLFLLSFLLVTFLASTAHTSIEDVHARADDLASTHGIWEYSDVLKKGATLHHFPNKMITLVNLDEEDKEEIACEMEGRRRWVQPYALYWMVIMSALSAFSMGMDETVVNGAQLFFASELGISDSPSILGMVVGAPYLSASILGTWMSVPLNQFFGRRMAITVAMIINIAASIWQATSSTWQLLFCARLLLGLGIGIVSSTVPVWTAECAPVYIRGGVVMLWQTFVAFGIMVGYGVCVAFVHTSDVSLGWRFMLGSTCVMPVFVAAFIMTAPESPRWLIKNNRIKEALHVLIRLRGNDILAARDLFAISSALEEEDHLRRHRFLIMELFVYPRSRRANVSACILMILQQSGVSTNDALITSLGAGVLNLVLSFPAIPLIDRIGRRSLILWTFPFMSLFLFLTALSFNIHDETMRVGLVATNIYLFVIAYSPGEGPVPMTYAGECYPMHIRSLGMSFATTVCWFFSFCLSISFPSLLRAFHVSGAFCFYGACCLIGWFVIFLIIPETAGLTLEQLDSVFHIRTRDHARYQIDMMVWRYRFWRERACVTDMPTLDDKRKRKGRT
ncbi:hypothetical protein PROFUN_08236 [Planoprotostelium fungivorum]|uniref:Major facilitator superfamily (MFS) profile domain-containing protein n=1 Tax=Planoprotostelium fungivorum TaxID=1890364 RepID=A0A2P6NK91_9EUKA|nr:hypothetical protein PROFUN_08236 [Planoprotostelium fungivorum]